MTDLIIPSIRSTLRNFLSVLTSYGLILPDGTDLYDLTDTILRLKNNQTFNEVVQNHYPEFLEAFARYGTFKEVFVQNLKKTLNPRNFGIDRDWRQTQREALEAIIYSVHECFTRPVSEIPTGGGKSMVLGAIARAYYDTLVMFEMEREIVLVTSRVNLVDQLMELVTDEENYDEPLDIGDVRMWFPNCSESDIRILAGETSSDFKEISKKSVITIVTYHGLTPGKVATLFPRNPGLVLLDECHRVTERVMMCLNQWQAFFMGYSATVIGPQMRDPFQFFDPSVKMEEEIAEAASHNELFAFYKSVIEMIQGGELKSVRWLNVKAKIDVSTVGTTSGSYSQRSVFNEESAAEILTRYGEVGYQVIREAYLTENPALELAGSLPVHKRRGLVSIQRIAHAKYYVDRCNKELLPELKEKYGEDVVFKAAYVDGSMDEEEFGHIMDDFENGVITLMFTAEKLSEGADLPWVNLIIILRMLGLGSQWKFKQFLGRGTRIDPFFPDGDLLVIDGVFESKRHNLASVFGILGQTAGFSGGLLMGNKERAELENKIFTLLNRGLKPSEVLALLDREELAIVERFGILKLYANNPVLNPQTRKISPYVARSIEFVERQDVRFNLSLDSPRELARMVMKELQKLEYCSEAILMTVRNHSLIAFSMRKFGRLGRGLDLVNLITGRNVTVLHTNVAVFDEFVKKLIQYGLPKTGNGRSQEFAAVPVQESEIDIEWNEVPGDPVGELIAFCQEKFGREPEFSTTSRVRIGDDWMARIAISQASFQIGEYHAVSRLCAGITKPISKHVAARELLARLKADLGSDKVNLYFGSSEFNLRVAALWKLIGIQNIHNVEYRFEELNKVHSCIAVLKKGKKEVEGKPAYHTDQEMVKAFALQNLFEVIHERAGSIKMFDYQSLRTHQILVEEICKKRGIILEYLEDESNHPYTIYTCTVRVTAPDRKPMVSCHASEIYKDAAREYSAKHMYNLLMATNYPIKAEPPVAIKASVATPQQRKPETLTPNRQHWDMLNKLKVEKSFKVKSTLEQITGPGNLMNISVKVEINQSGKTATFESRNVRTSIKEAGLNKAAAELIPQIKGYYSQSS